VITDPAVLARTIPGCEMLTQVGEDSYRMNVSVGVGAIRGTYAGEVQLSDQQRPKSYVMHASGAGAPGNARATVTINLEPDGDTTMLTYSADAVVGGPVAGVGQRMMTGVAKRMAAQFFKAIDNELTAVGIPAAAGAAPAAAPAAAAAPSAAGETAVTGAPAAAAPAVFAGKAAAAPAAGFGGDAQTLAVGALAGAALTLLGVLVGYRMGRRKA
jgi:carbon monoxide dehydrogenase subunit G